jgi:membrane protease YdiL (CAAX protease family)
MDDANTQSPQPEVSPDSASAAPAAEFAAPEPGAAATQAATEAQPPDPSTIEPPRPAKPIPTLGNTLLFFVLAIAVTTAVGLATIALGMMLPPFHEDMRSLALDARLAIPSQALQYLALLAVVAVVFGNIWKRPFWQAIQWNEAAVARRWLPLLGTGLALGLLSGTASNFLPMPKEAPILNDLMRSAAGAWMMFAFGTTLAPLMEEIAFRGFLLPSLLHCFERLRRRNQPEPAVALAYLEPSAEPAAEPAEDRAAPTPSAQTPSAPPTSPASESAPRPPSLLAAAAAILLASVPFALLHAQQVAGAWAPVLLIGLVSVVLCVVRLWTRSLAASALVHATYNFTLFAGMMIASDGFRHLDKLNS